MKPARKKQQSAARPSRLVATAPISPRETILLGLILLAGVALRLWALLHSAVEHFDEGVYASNIYFGPPDYAYPQQRFFGPPLVPALIEAGMIAGLPPNLAALLPSFLAGCATIAALWWVGRSWFGAQVGIAAAMLVALSDFHIAYSATALTDVLLGLWLVLAVDAIARSLSDEDFRWAVAAGIFTGLAWWTKYNGWLPLAVEGAAIPVLWLFLRPPRKKFATWLTCFAVTAIAAAAIWTPYFLSLRPTGGYGPIAANHAKYVVGFWGWFDAATRQISSQWMIEGPLSWIGLAMALALPAYLVPRSTLEGVRYFNLHLGIRLFAAAVLALAFTSFFVLGVSAVIGLSRIAIAFDRMMPRDEATRRRAIGLTIVATWFAGTSIATPCYTAYPRLVLPWLLAAWLGAPLIVGQILQSNGSQNRAHPWSNRKKLMTLLGGCVLFVIFALLCFPHEYFFSFSTDEFSLLSKNRRGIAQIAKLVRNHDVKHQPRAIYVFGEPAIFFQLRVAGEEIVAPVQEVPRQAATVHGKPVPTFLIAGPHAQTDPQFQQQWAAAQDRWQLVQTFDYQPSAIVWLDLHDPRRPLSQSEHNIRVYQLGK